MDMANQFLSLSLFIMLLSFFIIMNALSNYEDVKSKPVLNSISMAFSNKAPEEILSPNTVQSTQKSNNEGDTLDKLNDLFSAQITAAEVSKNRLGTMMHIRMPLKKFENSLLAPVRTNNAAQRLGEPGTFVATLVSLMQTRETQIPYRMDMVLNIDANPATAAANQVEQTNANMQNIATLAKKLEDSGLEKKFLSAGLGRGEVGMIDIYFTRYVPVNPLQNEGQR